MKYISVLILFFIFNSAFGQTPRETRAVWVSTNYRLDWPPPTYNEEEQKNELIKIFDTIEQKNLNTIYFQVRSNGTVLFKSSSEIFSPFITGDIGKFGSYDPLEFAIKEAHKRGIEIHAVVNTMRVFSGNDISVKNNPLHISQIHPEWVYEKTDGSIWLHPGIPEVRKYLVDLINEIVQNYNVDGIQLDFIRYPQEPILDIDSFKQFGDGEKKSNWRRNNITKFITQLNERIKATNPKIKLGVTPIGIYKSITNASGMEGFSDVFQDTREWLKLGIIDYAVPQIYWDTRTNPKFDVLAKDWVSNSFGKNIIIGIGAYKPEVLNEVEREINITRTLGASGMAFFRYRNIEHKRFYSFAEKTLPAEMPWIEDSPKLASLKLGSNIDGNKVSLKFTLDTKLHSENSYFALYEHDSFAPNSGNELIKVFPNYLSEISFTLQEPNKINYFYSTTEFDQLWNEASDKSNITSVSVPHLLELANNVAVFNNPILLQNGNNSVLIIFSNLDEEITLYNDSDKNHNSIVSKHFLKKGFNEIILNYDINKYRDVRINYLKNNRSVKLN